MSELQSAILVLEKYESMWVYSVRAVAQVMTRLKMVGPYTVICMIGIFGWYESRPFSLPVHNGSLNPALVPRICCAFLVLGGGYRLLDVLYLHSNSSSSAIRRKSDEAGNSVSIEACEMPSTTYSVESKYEGFALPGGWLVFTAFTSVVFAYIYILGRIGFIYSTSILLIAVIGLAMLTQSGKESVLSREGLSVMVKLIVTTVVTDMIFAHIFHIAGFK